MTVNEFSDFLLYDLATIAGAFIVIVAWVIIGIFIIATSVKKRGKE